MTRLVTMLAFKGRLFSLGLICVGFVSVGCSSPARQSPPVPPAAILPPAVSAGPSYATGLVRFTLLPQSEVRYRAREVLRALQFPTEAVGTTRQVTGSIAVDSSGAIAADESHVSVDLRGLRSDEPIRDNWIQESTLETSRFPTAVFRPVELRGAPVPLPTAGEVTFDLLGDLTVHGVSRRVTWVGSARIDGSMVNGSASTRVRITEFGMELPDVFRVLSMEDEITLELEFRARREAIPDDLVLNGLGARNVGSRNGLLVG